MHIVQVRRWKKFNPTDLNWLAKKAVNNELASDTLVRYYRRYGKRSIL